jgi:crossover junction endodeoxyribonuclease RusA
MTLSFFAAGTPQPQGSSKGYPIRRRDGSVGVAITTANVKLKPWRQTVQVHAQLALEQAGLRGQLAEGGVAITAQFYLPPPKAAESQLRKGRFVPMVKRPDVDKLARGLLDALTGVIFADDSQVMELLAGKVYAQPGRQPGVWVHIGDAGPRRETPHA